MELVLASRNKGKIKEMETLLKAVISDKIRVLSIDDIGYSEEIEENGTTFEENALIKASVPANMGYYGIADDSGLEVDALGGEPGVYSARYSGPESDSEKNNDKLLNNLKNVPADKRTARFVSAIAFVSPDGDSFTVRGVCEGKIISERKGDGGFGYDPLFLYEPEGKTFSEMSEEEKNAVSHRGAAMRSFAVEMKKRYGSGLLK